MEQYIPKSALVAWAKETYLCENASMIRKVCYKQLLEHLDTLEVKEVDLEKYYHEFLEKEWFGNGCARTVSEMMAFTAKYFFELGLKAQKGE